jgi:hypothetical protein
VFAGPGSVYWPGQEEPEHFLVLCLGLSTDIVVAIRGPVGGGCVAFVKSVGLNKEMGVHVPFVPSSSCRVVPTVSNWRKEGHGYPRATARFEKK